MAPRTGKTAVGGGKRALRSTNRSIIGETNGNTNRNMVSMGNLGKTGPRVRSQLGLILRIMIVMSVFMVASLMFPGVYETFLPGFFKHCLVLNPRRSEKLSDDGSGVSMIKSIKSYPSSITGSITTFPSSMIETITSYPSPMTETIISYWHSMIETIIAVHPVKSQSAITNWIITYLSSMFKPVVPSSMIETIASYSSPMTETIISYWHSMIETIIAAHQVKSQSTITNWIITYPSSMLESIATYPSSMMEIQTQKTSLDKTACTQGNLRGSPSCCINEYVRIHSITIGAIVLIFVIDVICWWRVISGCSGSDEEDLWSYGNPCKAWGDDFQYDPAARGCPGCPGPVYRCMKDANCAMVCHSLCHEVGYALFFCIYQPSIFSPQLSIPIVAAYNSYLIVADLIAPFYCCYYGSRGPASCTTTATVARCVLGSALECWLFYSAARFHSAARQPSDGNDGGTCERFAPTGCLESDTGEEPCSDDE